MSLSAGKSKYMATTDDLDELVAADMQAKGFKRVFHTKFLGSDIMAGHTRMAAVATKRLKRMSARAKRAKRLRKAGAKVSNIAHF